jgi:thiol:disulfide interchange protein DsbA
MKFANTLLALAVALPLAAAALPGAAAEAGKDYVVLASPQPVATAGKIEVLEFFAYTCPHCFELEPTLNAWARKLPKDVVLKRQPVIFSDSWEPMARAYFALEDLGLVGSLHGDVFNALHIDEIRLQQPEVFFDWAARHGVDRARLKDAYYSFSTASKVSRAKQLARQYRVNGVPTLAVQGKYLTSASLAGSNENALAVVDALVQQERRRARR